MKNNMVTTNMESKIYGELHRPQFHFSPPTGWLNDPNGLVYFNGEYHLFYQHNPNDINWGPMHWGHAVSKDLLHWENLPIALEPDELGTIFSGSAVVDEHDTSGFFNGSAGLVAIFTHHGEYEHQSIAYSNDSGRTWVKYKNNPVISNDRSRAQIDFRDPKVFWHSSSKQWIMILGGGTFRIYKSNNLIDYELVSTLGVFEEFPDLFELCVDGDNNNRKWVLSLAGFGYYIGSFNGADFIMESEYINVDYGSSWQAALTFNNLPDDKRCIWIAWMRESSKGPTFPWRCNMSIPRELSLKTCKNGIRLIQKPIAELSNLRKNPYIIENIDLEPGTNILDGLSRDVFEIEAEFHIGSEVEFGLKLRKGIGQETVVGYIPLQKSVFVDAVSSYDPKYDEHVTSMGDMFYCPGNEYKIKARMYNAFCEPEGEVLRLHILVDRSTIETFVDDGRIVFTNNIYTSPDSKGMEIYAKGNGIKLISCKIYDIESTW